MHLAALNTLLAYVVEGERSAQPIEPRLKYYPFLLPGFSAQLSEYLERLNPGWLDTSFEFTLPPLAITLQPTRVRRDEVRKAAHAMLDEALDREFARIDEALTAVGSVPTGKPIVERRFDWAVRRVVLNRSYNALERDLGLTRTGIREGVEEVCDAVGLPRPSR